MNQYLLPILLVGACINAQNTISNNHKYLHIKQVEIDNTQGQETETWNYEQVYDIPNKKIKEIRHLNIDANNGEQILIGYTTVSYPSNNVVITEEKSKNDSGNFVPVTRVKYEYNNKGLVKKILQEEYNTDTNEYENKALYTFTHTTKGLVKSILWQEYVDDGEEKILNDLFKDTFSYDTKGRLIQNLRVDNSDNSPLERRTYRYNAQGLPLGYIWEETDESGNYTKVFEQEIETENGNAVSIVDYNYEAGIKKKDILYVNSFDENILSEEVFSFKDIDSYIRFYEHHWYQNKNAKIAERNFSFDSHPIVNDWKQEKSFRNEYKNIEETLGIYDVAQNKDIIQLLPNPTDNYFRINLKSEKIQIEVYDFSGKLVKSFANKEEKYDISTLNTGVYMVVVKYDNTKQTIKLIKK